MPADRDLRSQVLTVATLLLTASLVGSLWVVDYVPTSDGPNHILAGYLAVHLRDPAKGYDAFLEPGGAVTSLAFHTTFTTLLHAMPWRHALRVTLSIGALAWAVGFARLATAVHKGRGFVGLFGFATALSWTFYMGLFSYWMALGIDLLILAFVLRRPSPTVRDRVVLSLAIVVAMFAHSFAATLLGFALGVITLVRPGPRGRLRELGILAIVSAPGLSLAYLSAQDAATHAVTEAGADHLLQSTWLTWHDRIDVLWQCFSGGPAWRGIVPIAAAFVGIVAAVVRARRGRASREEMAVASLAVLLLSAVVLTPIHLNNLWRDVSPRFLPLGATLGIVLLPIEELTRPAHELAASGAIVLFTIAAAGWSWVHHARLYLASTDVMEVLRAPVHRRGPRLPIVLAPPEGSVAQVQEHVLLGDLFVIDQGGMTPYLYAVRRGLHPLVWRRPRGELFPRFPTQFYGQFLRESAGDPRAAPRPVHLALLAEAGAPFEDVILWGTPEDVAAFEARGFVADAKRGGAAILRFVPCGLRVEVGVGDAPALRNPVVVEYGWAPLEQRSTLRVFPRGTHVEGGQVRAEFGDAPCGPVWVRAFEDAHETTVLQKGEPTCEGADEHGRLHGDLLRGGGRVRCHLPIAP